ncbi:hypothetical protein ACFW6K_17125 [Streptomyces sp. NPDC058733]|uniref:hypothetical protein n=1 Tax=Streptomyces sp. NPDC058733 TaxID=3346614 RepID=UPI0036ABA371
MSRETDTPSSGPKGRGGAAYPSGTPPYGTPTASGDGTDAGRAGTRPEEKKTETTLTTRIRINIPGSRPIPPVVVRKPVGDGDAAETEGAEPVSGGAAASAPAAEAPAESAPQTEERPTSDWFAPRKSAAPKGGQAAAAGNGANGSGGSGASGVPGTSGGSAAGASGVPGASGAPGANGAQGTARPGSGRPGGVVGSMSVPGGSRPGGANGSGRPGANGSGRPGGTNGSGLPGATGGPVAPGHGGGTGSFDVTEALAAGPLGGSARSSDADAPTRDDLPYFSEPGDDRHDFDTPGGPAGPGAPGGPGGPGRPGGPGGSTGFDGPNGPGAPGGRGPQGPSGPTGGPVTGDGPVLPPVPGAAGPGPGGTPPGVPGTWAPGTTPGAGLSDDTAILTPQKPAPEPPGGGYGGHGHDNVSGHTVTSGIPVVPPGDRGTGPFGAGPDGPAAHTPPKLPEPVAQNVPASRPPKKKGRRKLPLLVGGVVVLAAGVYGAGLLMNHSDVPKGTTVLGVDIGGGTRDEAVKKLDAVLGGRVNQPLKLSVDGSTVALKPDQAGLHFDEDATVAAAARSDYNPVSVIGSLFGQQRPVDPVMPVDEEKLQAALQNAAGGSGAMTDGTIRFESGKAVAVYGKPGKGIDVDRSKQAVEQAYRTQVETGAATPVRVPTTNRQPTVSNAEVDRMMKEFAEPAMSAKVTVMTDAAHKVAFSPQKSLWKFLRVKAVGGKLVDSYDEAALKELYGKTFDGVLIARANGQKTPVTVQDVYGALRLALKSTSNRVAVIETDPS